jgi:hypothetical protein
MRRPCAGAAPVRQRKQALEMRRFECNCQKVILIGLYGIDERCGDSSNELCLILIQ